MEQPKSNSAKTGTAQCIRLKGAVQAKRKSELQHKHDQYLLLNELQCSHIGARVPAKYARANRASAGVGMPCSLALITSLM